MLLILFFISLTVSADFDVDFEGVSVDEHSINISGETTTSGESAGDSITFTGDQQKSFSFPPIEEATKKNKRTKRRPVVGVTNSRSITVASGGSFRSRLNQLWNKCGGSGCTIVQPWIAGDKAHCERSSCHNSRQAMDIHTIKCGGRTYKQGREDFKLKFSTVAACMKRAGNTTVLWQVAGHHGHIHVNFSGCNKKRGCGNQVCLDKEREYVL